MYICIYICMYIYMYRERERDLSLPLSIYTLSLSLSLYIYIYIYITIMYIFLEGGTLWCRDRWHSFVEKGVLICTRVHVLNNRCPHAGDTIP